MAKKKDAAQGEPSVDKETGKKVHAGRNGYDAKKLTGYCEEIEGQQAKIDAIMQEAKDKCAPMREEITAIKKAANENDGIPRREFNAVLQVRKLDRKSEQVRETLSEEQQDEFDQMCLALGMLADTPLGQAAMH